MKSPLRAPTSGSATNAMFVNAVSATTISVNAHWTGSPTMKCDSMLSACRVPGSFDSVLGPRCQPDGSGTCFAYQRASAICRPVCRISSTNCTW